MNAPLRPELLLASGRAAAPAAQPGLPLATAGVQRIVWESRYGRILIEVEGDEVRVNGQAVPRHAPPA